MLVGRARRGRDPSAAPRQGIGYILEAARDRLIPDTPELSVPGFSRLPLTEALTESAHCPRPRTTCWSTTRSCH
jgi:hypothetical protein